MNKSKFSVIKMPYADVILREQYPAIGSLDIWEDVFYVHKNGGMPKPEELHECDQFDTFDEALKDAVSKFFIRTFKLPEEGV